MLQAYSWLYIKGSLLVDSRDHTVHEGMKHMSVACKNKAPYLLYYGSGPGFVEF